MSVPALAWGPEGHSLVARLAETELTPEARAQIAILLEPGESLRSTASWADEVRRSRPQSEGWHYINIPIDKPGLNMTRDCPAKGCIIEAITRFRGILADPGAPRNARREALLFVVHFIGDLHQPLHSSNDADKGGNEVTISFSGERMNLHRLWDSGLLNRMPSEDDLFAKFWSDLTPEKRAVWATGTVESWAEETHHAAAEITYGKLPKVRKTEAAQLDASYERAADALIEQQIAKAGVRLAFVLNSDLKPMRLR
jgi:hypothetical protein